VRYRTAAILTAVLIGGIFVLPNVVLTALINPSLKQGFPDPVPGYELLLLQFTSFCFTWRLPFALPIIAAPLSIAALSGKPRSSTVFSACKNSRSASAHRSFAPDGRLNLPLHRVVILRSIISRGECLLQDGGD